LPVVWAVARGSLRNKAILVPLALALSAFAPWAVMPLLMLGGVYLCLEGMEKLAHPLLHGKEEDAAHETELEAMLTDPAIDPLAVEAEKVKGAIRTDFVLSAEIIAITLGTVANAVFTSQLVVLVGVALIMTVGVYGFVGLLVKLDDIGLYLLRQGGSLRSLIGHGLIHGMPWLMKTLAVIGTVAMFMVGGCRTCLASVPWPGYCCQPFWMCWWACWPVRWHWVYCWAGSACVVEIQLRECGSGSLLVCLMASRMMVDFTLRTSDSCIRRFITKRDNEGRSATTMRSR